MKEQISALCDGKDLWLDGLGDLARPQVLDERRPRDVDNQDVRTNCVQIGSESLPIASRRGVVLNMALRARLPQNRRCLEKNQRRPGKTNGVRVDDRLAPVLTQIKPRRRDDK